MKHIRFIILVAFAIQALCALGQSNLLENGGFEADFNNQHYPRIDSNLFLNSPFPWLDYNPGDDERWYIDSVWVPPNINVQNPGFQNGYYSFQFTNIGAPWESGTDKILQPAHSGGTFIGFNTKSDLFAREGIQTKMQNNCKFNSGDYTASLWWARTFPRSNTKFWLYLSDQSSTRRKKIGKLRVNEGTFSPGQWYFYTNNFELKLNKNLQMGNHWFSITGRSIINSNYEFYMYFDDIRLFRQCDIDSACFNPTGQICPLIALQLPPAPPFKIRNIENANALKLRIAAIGGQVLIDTTFTNPNGLPDFYWPGEILANSVASGTYSYELTLSNKCGAFGQNDLFTVQNGIYDTLTPWIDSTATWSEVPKECCLHTLTLRDLEITGDVSYIVKDTIWITDGVTAAPGSDILIQAGQVVEMDSVEFDGTNTVVEILEAPCQGCRLLPPSSGGTAPDMAEIGTAAVITASRPLNRLETQGVPISTSEVPNFRESATEAVGDFLTGLSAYPNPFTDKITLEVELAKSGSVSLTVFDLSMRPVIKAAKGEILSEGIHSFQVDLSPESSGIYFVQLVANGRTFTEKVVKQ
jgi:hypothetical protein